MKGIAMNRFWKPPPASCFCVHAIRRCVLAFFPLWCAAAGADGFDVSGTDPAALPVVPAGFVATMPAREPLVQNVSMLAFDTRGRLFVAMGPQYRNPRDNTPGDAIVMLVDADADGTFEATKPGNRSGLLATSSAIASLASRESAGVSSGPATLSSAGIESVRIWR